MIMGKHKSTSSDDISFSKQTRKKTNEKVDSES